MQVHMKIIHVKLRVVRFYSILSIVQPYYTESTVFTDFYRMALAVNYKCVGVIMIITHTHKRVGWKSS